MTTVHLCESRRERKCDAIEWVLFAATALKTLRIVDVRIQKFLEKKITIMYLLRKQAFRSWHDLLLQIFTPDDTFCQWRPPLFVFGFKYFSTVTLLHLKFIFVMA